jgi:hypothetical protein
MAGTPRTWRSEKPKLRFENFLFIPVCSAVEHGRALIAEASSVLLGA